MAFEIGRCKAAGLPEVVALWRVLEDGGSEKRKHVLSKVSELEAPDYK